MMGQVAGTCPIPFFSNQSPLWITFRQIIFPSARRTDRPKVDPDTHLRNLRVDKNRLAGRRFLCTFVAPTEDFLFV